jgi:hypothetical protein
MPVVDFEKLLREIARAANITIVAVCHAPRYVAPVAADVPRKRPREPSLLDDLGRDDYQSLAKVVARIHSGQQPNAFSESDFRMWLESHAKGKGGSYLSLSNVKSVLSSVANLVSGAGQAGKLWTNTFRECEPVTLDEDLDALKERAIAFTKQFGVDPRDPRQKKPFESPEVKGDLRRRAARKGERYDASNGWVLTHPIQKLIEYKAWKSRVLEG